MFEAIKYLIPIVALMIPIVAILTAHQRRMAELMRQGNPQANPNDLSDLRQDVQQLKEIVAQQAIQMDDFLSSQRKLAAGPPPAPNELQSRIGS